jgi:hypothetical protein
MRKNVGKFINTWITALPGNVSQIIFIFTKDEVIIFFHKALRFLRPIALNLVGTRGSIASISWQNCLAKFRPKHAQ